MLINTLNTLTGFGHPFPLTAMPSISSLYFSTSSLVIRAISGTLLLKNKHIMKPQNKRMTKKCSTLKMLKF